MFQDYKVAYLRENLSVKEARPLTFLRKSVGYMLSQSAREIPHAAMNVDYDVTNLIEYTKARDQELKAESGKTTPDKLIRRAVLKNHSAFFIKALSHVLYHMPMMNAFLDYRTWRPGGALYLSQDINLSFTVHTQFGVIKPIAHNAHQKDLVTVAQEMRSLTRRARNTDPEDLYRRAARAYIKTALRQLDITGLGALWGYLLSQVFDRHKPDPSVAHIPEDRKLKVEEVLGATCTLANIGTVVRGHQTVTVIIPPEVMMFGLGDLHQEPRVVDGQVVPRWIVTLCAVMDHRAFDAGEVLPYVDHLNRYIQNPALIYEWEPGDAI